MTPAELKAFEKQKAEYLDKALKGLDADIAALQRRLFNELTDKLIIEFDTDKGKIQRSSRNFTLINNRFADLMDEFTRQFTKSLTKKIAEKMLQNIVYTDDYYKDGLNVSETEFAAMKEASKWVYDRVGITENGALIPGGYFDELAKMPEVRTAIRNYIVNNVTSEAGLVAFQKGFKELIEGTPDLPGTMQKYHAQFSFDVFNQVDNAINYVYAKTNALDYFVYSGTVMARTRCFCEKRNNKVFSIKDTAKWKNDVSLLSYYDTHPYNPLVDLGGFNCRHHLFYIDKRTAEAMGYDPVKAEAILDETCD